MSCTRMKEQILPYLDGRLKDAELRDMEKHLAACAVCRLRVNEFRSVTALLDELPKIEPSAAFDVRVRARVAAEPAKQSWWAWFTPSPRVAFAASMLLLALVWIGTYSSDSGVNVANSNDDSQIMQNLPVLENYDVISNFEPLTDLSQPEQTDDSTQQM
jgi:anti-sigma factor RsiW